jgi:hypothetical protein
LEKFQENSLLENVNLYVEYSDYVLRVLTKIVPLISSIHSIQIDSNSSFDLLDMVYNKNIVNHGQSLESQLLLKEMMAKTQIVSTKLYSFILFCLRFFKIHLHRYMYHSYEFGYSWEDKMDWCCSWLYTPMNDGKARMLRSYDYIYEPTYYYSFIERIKKAYYFKNLEDAHSYS